MEFQIEIYNLKAVNLQQHLSENCQKKSQNRSKMTCKNRWEPGTSWRRAKAKESWEMICYIKSCPNSRKNSKCKLRHRCLRHRWYKSWSEARTPQTTWMKFKENGPMK